MVTVNDYTIVSECAQVTSLLTDDLLAHAFTKNRRTQTSLQLS